MLTFRSFCSGIGAPELAWSRLSWRCLSTSEIDAQASAVLAHHHGAPNLGDMEKMDNAGPSDVYVAGTPCQSFSVAGLRKGMADPRGNLALVFLRLVDRGRPEWVVWENVPGVLSSGGGRDFGSFLGGLGQLGYGFAYRVLDAQFVRVESHAWAVPQRRRRVFVVAHLGDWRRAAAVLLERESLCGHPAPSREAGARVANALTRCLGSGGADDNRAQGGMYVPDVSPAMKARDAKGPSSDGDGDGLPLVAHSLRAEGHDASEDGTGRGTPIVFGPAQITSPGNYSQPKHGDPCHPLTSATPVAAYSVCLGSDPISARELAMPQTRRNGDPGVVAYAIQERAHSAGTSGPEGRGYREGVVYTMEARHRPQNVAAAMHVRRLTPRECERLQGFPDDYTQVLYKGKPMADAARYRMLGNSMAVNVMSWIGQRIALVSATFPGQRTREAVRA